MTTPQRYPFFNVENSYYGVGPDDQIFNGIDSSFLEDDEKLILQKLRSQLTDHVKTNMVKQSYYEASQVIRHLDIAVPRTLTDIGTAVGWAGTVVDALDERIEFLGWTADDNQLNGLDLVYLDNYLNVESNLGHLDALITGLGFVSVGANEDFPDQQLITIESSSSATLLWDYRKRRSLAGLSVTTDSEGHVVMESLYLENANIVFARNVLTGEMEIISRDDHNLGRCFMTRLPNRARPFQLDGRSEITRAVRYYTDAAVRTMLGMEVNREFYTAPQRFVLNARPEDFGVTAEMSKEERFQRGLSVAMGMINIVPPRGDNTEGDPPSVVEMKPAPPTPYIEQIKAYSIQMAAETGLPATMFGFVTDNPTSADAIVKSEFRLTRRAQRRIGSFGRGWKEVGILALLARDGAVDTDFVRRLQCKFANPMLPTPAATADEIQKMIASNVLVPDSTVTYELYGRLDEQQVKRLEADKRAHEAKMMRKAMQEQAMAAATAAAQQPQNGIDNSPQARRAPASDTQQAEQ
jgi:hypothetical protein